MADIRPDELVGEIVQGRYAVLERTGADRFKVFDMKELCQVELLRWDDQWLPLPSAPRAAPKPPPIPAAALAPKRQGRRRVATGRFEAAWFAHGEQLELGEAEAEVTDYQAYQAHLEEMAATIDGRPAIGESLTKREQQTVLLFAFPEPA